ncbi:hypothetical protein CRG98_031177 [Punica granatum]|uniref:Uncharacterized protein n=1 Tax=Punica granatum TaxID=22663 RepID=A0A2I0IWX1_PUNGR|nr:hypothetical protein CRG98_031177 [Punica granatum]
MPSLITLPSRPVAVLSPEEVQSLIEEKAAKAIPATKRKELGLPSPNENLQSPLSQDIFNTKGEEEMLRASYERFFKFAIEIESLNPHEAMFAFQRGIKGGLKKSFIVIPL